MKDKRLLKVDKKVLHIIDKDLFVAQEDLPALTDMGRDGIFRPFYFARTRIAKIYHDTPFCGVRQLGEWFTQVHDPLNSEEETKLLVEADKKGLDMRGHEFSSSILLRAFKESELENGLPVVHHYSRWQYCLVISSSSYLDGAYEDNPGNAETARSGHSTTLEDLTSVFDRISKFVSENIPKQDTYQERLKNDGNLAFYLNKSDADIFAEVSFRGYRGFSWPILIMDVLHTKKDPKKDTWEDRHVLYTELIKVLDEKGVSREPLMRPLRCVYFGDVVSFHKLDASPKKGFLEEIRHREDVIS